MPWCPECRVEYREGFTACNDCECALVDELEPIREEKIIYDRETFLTTVPDDIQAGILESALREHNIPVLKKHREAGGYMQIYMGMARFGIDLYVPSRLLESAKEIVESLSPGQVLDPLDTEPAELSQLERDFFEKRRKRTMLILLIFFIPGLLGIIAAEIYNAILLARSLFTGIW